MRQVETRCNTAHHDGSASYMPGGPTGRHGVVDAFVVTARRLGTRRLWARTTPDGDARFAEGVVDRVEGDLVWWRVPVTVHNPDTGYRFWLDTVHGPRWLTAAGLVTGEVPDATDFAVTSRGGAPGWASSAVAYQIFPDRFARSGRIRTPAPDWAVPAAWDEPIRYDTPDGVRQLYGGDLWGVTERLDHVQRLGADLLYLTPFFPARSNHRYDAVSFDTVDPLLGGDEALAALTAEAHRRGMRVVGDITLNHTGDDHPWFRTAMADPSSAERAFYHVDPVTGRYATFADAETLPKLDHRSAELRARLYDGPASVVGRYLRAPFHLDGWRVDVAQSTGRHRDVELNDEAARTTRRTLDEVAPGSLLVAEHGFDASRTLRGDGWHGTMAYSGFARPVWSWLAERRDQADFWGVPGPVPHVGGDGMVESMRRFASVTPWAAQQASFTLLDSHDTQRFRWVAGPERQLLGAGLMLTLPGIPMIFAGDEVGVTGRHMEDARRPFPWDEGRWDRTTWHTYQDLVTLRGKHPALATGSMRWVHAEAETVLYERADADGRLLVQVSRGAHDALTLDVGATALHGADDVRPGDPLPDGPGVHVWRLDD